MTDEEAIVKLYRDENRAMVTKNLDKLNAILADSMHLTHMTGYVQPKFEWIDQIQNGEMLYLSSKEDAIKEIQINGNQASLIGQNRVQAKIWSGGANTWSLQMQMSYQKRDGQWIITDQVASTY